MPRACESWRIDPNLTMLLLLGKSVTRLTPSTSQSGMVLMKI